MVRLCNDLFLNHKLKENNSLKLFTIYVCFDTIVANKCNLKFYKAKICILKKRISKNMRNKKTRERNEKKWVNCNIIKESLLLH